LELRYTGYKAEIELHPEMPTGPMNRVADNLLAKKLLGWEPKVKFMEGLRTTIVWYFSTKDRKEVQQILDRVLTERMAETPSAVSAESRIERRPSGGPDLPRFISKNPGGNYVEWEIDSRRFGKQGLLRVAPIPPRGREVGRSSDCRIPAQ